VRLQVGNSVLRFFPNDRLAIPLLVAGSNGTSIEEPALYKLPRGGGKRRRDDLFAIHLRLGRPQAGPGDMVDSIAEQAQDHRVSRIEASAAGERERTSQLLSTEERRSS
jgi:hypothetical protein